MIQGHLVLQDNGRYIVKDCDYELTSGNVVEVLVSEKWIRTTVESVRGKYYLTNNFPIDGAYVRIQRSY